MEDPESRQMEADLGAGQRPGEIGLPKEGTGRMAARAVHDRDEILAAFDVG
jgi:hypothetical protein